METPNKNLLNQQNQNTNNLKSGTSDQLIERELIEGTPFWIIKQNETHTLVMGNYKINHKEIHSKEEALQFLKDEMWNLMCTVMLTLIHNEEKIKDQTKKPL